MSLSDHIDRVLDRKVQAKRVEEQLRQAREQAEARAAAETEARMKREEETRTRLLASKAHLVYIGRGLSVGQPTYSTRVDEWRYQHRHSYTVGHRDWTEYKEVPESISYRGRETFHLERLTTVDETETETVSGLLLSLLRPKKRERVVGYYLPEWDVSITTELVREVCAYQGSGA